MKDRKKINVAKELEIPQGIEVIREVTEEKEYRNSVIAQKYGVPADE